MTTTVPQTPALEGDAPVDVVTVADDVPRARPRRSFDELASSVGALAGSFALVWLVYERLLPLAGRLGFAVLWFVTYLLFVVALARLAGSRAVVADRVLAATVQAAALLCVAAGAWVIGFVAVRAWPAVRHLNFFTDDMAGVRPTDELDRGGILGALGGSAVQVVLALVIAAPVAVATAFVVSESSGRRARRVRLVLDAATAVPSLLAGLLVYAAMVSPLGGRANVATVAAALAVVVTPGVARATVRALADVPADERRAVELLGGTARAARRWVLWRASRRRVVAALLGAAARALGEAGPLLVLVGTFPLGVEGVEGPPSSLARLAVSGLLSGERHFVARAHGAIAVMIVLVTGIVLASRRAMRTPAVVR